MEIEKKGCIINASWGKWYPRGSERLERSLIYHGWNYDLLVWKDEPINDMLQKDFPYTVKAAAFMEAVNRGYTRIIWMDCSLWVTKNPNILMDIVDGEGGLFIRSGYNLAQTSADSDLKWANSTRDEAEKIEELWSCIFGVNLETPQGKAFAYHFIDAYFSGVFNTPREHSGLSADSRFLHARQDQTAASWAFHKAGYNKIYPSGNFLTQDVEGKDSLIKMRGM